MSKTFLTLCKKIRNSKIALSIAVIVMVFTTISPRPVAASDSWDAIIWAQSWVPAEFLNTLPVAKEQPRQVRYITVTAYSSTPDQTDATPFIAASGKTVHDGMVAANFLHFGTRVKFPDFSGDKVYIVEDRMHERFSNRMDIWMETREEAVQFGIRRLKVEIY